MLHALGLETGHGIDGNVVDAAEDAVFDVGIVALQAAEQQLDFLPLGAASAVVAHGAVLGKAAGTLDKFQIVVPLPGQNILLPDAVHGPDQRHAGEAGAVELGGHGLHLGAIEHAHHGSLDHIVEVVAQGDFVAAQFLGLAVQMAAAHPCAEVAGVLVGVVGNGKNVALENRYRDVQQFGVGLDLLAVDLVVAGVHHQKDQFKGHVAVSLQFLHQLCHQHGVFAARDADGDLVACLYQFIALDRYDKGRPQFPAVFFDDTAFDHLIGFQFTFHLFPLTLSMRGGQLVVAGVERLQKCFDLVLGRQVAQADAPGGQGVAPVAADGKHGPGGQAVRRTGRFYRHADPLGVQFPLEHRTLYVLNTQVQHMGNGVVRAVDAHQRIGTEGAAQFCVQLCHMLGPLGLLVDCQFQRTGQRGRQRHGWGSAAVDGGALAAMDERFQCQIPPLEQQADAVQPVELVGGQAHGVHTLERNRDFTYGLGGIHMQVAVGILL